MQKVLLTVAAGILTFLSLGFLVPGTALAQQYPPLTSCYNELMDIGVGDPCVGSVQLALNGLNISNPPLEVDHIYGNTTKSAIMAFQEKLGLTKDGVAGRATITALFEATHVSQPPAAPAQTTPTTCTPHVGNTQGWIDCKGGSAPMWVRLSYVCSINAGPVHLRDQTYTTKWEMVEANSTHTISQECTQKILSAKADMRPF